LWLPGWIIASSAFSVNVVMGSSEVVNTVAASSEWTDSF